MTAEDLLCGEEVHVGQSPMQHEKAEEAVKRDPTTSGADQAHEDVLTSMLSKMDAYRPVRLPCMEDSGENWTLELEQNQRCCTT